MLTAVAVCDVWKLLHAKSEADDPDVFSFH